MLTVVGVILLLPGVCAAFLMATIRWDRAPSRASDFLLLGFWLVCFLIAAGGALLLYSAFSGIKRRGRGAA